MATEFSTYEKYEPGQLIDANRMNKMQALIKQDIIGQTKKAIEEIKSVKNAENATLLGGKGFDEILKDILEKVFQELPKKTGYLRLFKQLKVGDEEVIKHNLKAFPLVDIYQLDYFRVVCSEDGNKPYDEWVNFYLYHSSEKKIRLEKADGKVESIPIEPTDGHAFKIPFKDMLDSYKVEYTEDSSLGDVETEFWKAFFSDPNDNFDDDQYCHSPWFDRCCREGRNMGSLGDAWNDLWFQMRPRKTVNFLPAVAAGNGAPTPPPPTPAPTQVEVVHFDLDNIGIKVLDKPIYPLIINPEDPKNTISLVEYLSNRGRDISQELKLMLLLKV
ncbi:MAG TPA: hypothetical protein DCE56_45110 [Cyanobacteria bacterium UBA8553]|nr:hypothetical protein [Cyanobacteria bacterium UBA8553]